MKLELAVAGLTLQLGTCRQNWPRSGEFEDRLVAAIGEDFIFRENKTAKGTPLSAVDTFYVLRNIKTLTKELRQEIVSYLYPLPSISSNLAFRLAIHIFTKTRFSSHINFISRCLQRKVILKGFRSNFHASIFSNVSNFNLKYLHEIQRTQNTFSHIMRSTIRAMCSKRNELNKQIIECHCQLSNVCPSVLLRSIHAKIQALNS